MNKLRKIRSEANIVLDETKYGQNPSWRRHVKKAFRKAVRANKQRDIASRVRNWDIELDEESDMDLVNHTHSESVPFWVQVQLDSMWHNWEIEAKEEDRYLRNRYPYMYHETDTWSDDESWVEDAEEFFHGEEF